MAEPVQENGLATDIAGCAVVSIAAPEALLPPPWPSRAPLRCCISNLAVADAFRRRGVARQLLAACECLGNHPELLSCMAINGEAILPTRKTAQDHSSQEFGWEWHCWFSCKLSKPESTVHGAQILDVMSMQYYCQCTPLGKACL